MKLIGLTGGMGCGKTTVAKLFEEMGALVLDADAVARKTRAPGSAGHDAILARFQTVDRLELRRILSESPEAKKDLESILHPLIRAESDREISRLQKAHPDAPCLLYEATLLIEAGRVQDFDQLIVVTAPLQSRIARIASRDRVSPEDALLIIQSQNTDEFRLPFADYVIENPGDLPDLKQKVRKVLDQIISS